MPASWSYRTHRNEDKQTGIGERSSSLLCRAIAIPELYDIETDTLRVDATIRESATSHGPRKGAPFLE